MVTNEPLVREPLTTPSHHGRLFIFFMLVRGAVFRDGNRRLLFQDPDDGEGPLLDYSMLTERIVARSTETCPGKPFVEPQDLNMGTIIALWSICTREDAMASPVLLRSAKLALRNSADKARRLQTMVHLATQGLAQQVVSYAPDPHAFGHPLLRNRCIEFQIFPCGQIQMLPGMPDMLDLESAQKDSPCDFVSTNMHEALQQMEDALASLPRKEWDHPSAVYKAIRKESDRHAKSCHMCGAGAQRKCPCCAHRFCSAECQNQHHKAAKKT
jgi:hypothetical protein